VLKLLSSLVLAAVLAGCSTPRLPDPTINYPTPPAALMEPGRDMKVIPN